jgi:hypothetical protein
MFASSQEGTVKQSTRPRKTANLSESLHRQLNSYALAASAAGVGMFVLTQPALAKVIYTKTHFALPPNTLYNLDLNHDGTIDFILTNRSGGTTGGLNRSYLDVKSAYSNEHKNEAWNALAYKGFGRGYAAPLKPGRRIGPKGDFESQRAWGLATWTGRSETMPSGPWCNLSRRYLGLKFAIKGETHFGWARLNVTCTDGIAGLLTGYAYETIPNKPIIAGKTKGPDVVTIQPASLGHLAHGASAIPAWRGANPVAATH